MPVQKKRAGRPPIHVPRQDLPLSFDQWLPAQDQLDAADKAAGEAPKNVLDWAERWRRPENRPFSLARFLPLKQLYEEDHPHVCVIKPAQRGVSEFAINRACFALELGAARWNTSKNGLNVAYLFPTQSALSDFSKERLTGLRSESAHLHRLFADEGFGGVSFKQVGNSYLYLRGAWSESALLSFSADMLVLDEYDRMDPKAIALARRRMSASPLRHELDISTPTLPGRGIDALYKQSDGLQYHQECPHCGAANVYDFFRDVRVGGLEWADWHLLDAPALAEMGAALHCPECQHALTDADRLIPGVWLPQRPRNSLLRGYQIPALAFPMVSLDRFVAASINTDPHEQTQFFNSDLGQPFDAAGARVTSVMLLQLSLELAGGRLPAPMRWQNVTMGVDVGARYHYRISGTASNGERYVLAMGEAANWDELSHLITRWRVKRTVIDALPELNGTMQWATTYKGRVLRAFYPSAAGLGGALFRVDDKKHTINIDRTMAMDGVYDAIASAHEHWPAEFCRHPVIVAHLGAPVRTVTADPSGQARASWEHTTPDHYFHACVYDRLAFAALDGSKIANRRPVFAQGRATGWSPAR